MTDQFRERTPAQLAVTALLVAVEILGITALLLGHRDLGRTLVGLGIVALAPVTLWIRTTSARGAGGERDKR